jgi:hypothetical protein
MPARRDSDPEGEDHGAERRVDPTQWVADIGYGRWSVKLYSYALLIAGIGLAIVGANVFSARAIEGAIERFAAITHHEHAQEALENRRTRCVLALNAEQRAALIADRYPGAWTRACWWLSEEPLR